jgi:phosphoribosylanthranilate isomerase
MGNITRVKICGITNIEDALLAAEYGADALGFVFADSPRKVTPDLVAEIVSQLPPFIATAGVFVNSTLGEVKAIADYCNLDTLQLHGEENLDYCSSFRQNVIKAFRLKNYTEIEEWLSQENKFDSEEMSRVIDGRFASVQAFLVDAYARDKRGGTGIHLNWELVRNLKSIKPLILAGGLDHKNVAAAIEAARPYGVDVSSGVELKPGKKDKRKLREFLVAVRECG